MLKELMKDKLPSRFCAQEMGFEFRRTSGCAVRCGRYCRNAGEGRGEHEHFFNRTATRLCAAHLDGARISVIICGG